MTWIEKLRGISGQFEFRFPMGSQELEEVERLLLPKFPSDLKSLLSETDGVVDEYGLDLVWGIERIREDNLSFRNNTDFKDLYMPFDNLLLFGDAGNGDIFAYPIQNNEVRRPDIFIWDHESDSRSWVANSLQEFLIRWASGDLIV